MTELEPHGDGIESMLRRSMAAPEPKISPDFEKRLMCEVERRVNPLGRNGWLLLGGYGIVSVATCVAVMMSQRLSGWMTTGMILGPIVLTATVIWAVLRGSTPGQRGRLV